MYTALSIFYNFDMLYAISVETATARSVYVPSQAFTLQLAIISLPALLAQIKSHPNH